MPGMRILAGRSAGSLLILSLILASPASGQRKSHGPQIGFPVVTLQGTVRMDGGDIRNAHAVARITTTSGEAVDEVLVNSDGGFIFEDLGKQSYYLTVTGRGYAPSTQLIDLSNVGNTYLVSVTLAVLDPAEATGTSLASRTDATAPKKARKQWEEGVRSSGLKKLDEAEEHFTKAVTIYPCYARAQTDLALTLMREHQAPQAEGPLKKAIECDPDYTEAYLHLGRLLNALNRYSEGHSVLAEGVRRLPSSWRLYYNLAQADEGLNNFPVAEKEFLRALSFGPTAPVVHERLADLYLKVKSYDKAYAEMQSYLTAAPQGRYAERVRSVMQELVAKGLVHPAGNLTAGPPPTS